MSSTERQGKSLAAIIDRKNADGSFAYSDADVGHYLPFVLLVAKVPLETVPQHVQDMVGQLAIDAELDLAAGAERVQEQLVAFYERKPVHAALHAEVMAFLRDVRSQGGETSAAVGALLGTPRVTGVLGGGSRPAGTVPGGPMARFAVPPKKG